MTVAHEAQRIFTFNHEPKDEQEMQSQCRNYDVNLYDLGDEEWKETRKMKHMYAKDKDGNLQPYDFSNMKICSSNVALNSQWFCTGLVGEFDLNKQVEATRRKNDKRSLLGIFKFDPESCTAKIETWINTVSGFKFYDPVELVFNVLCGRQHDHGDVYGPHAAKARLPLPALGLRLPAHPGGRI